jgi:membrane-associated phospholipid phosphatase
MLKQVHDILVYWDHIAWFYINTQWRNPFLDMVAPFIRNQWFWAPLYFFLLLFMPLRFRMKGWLWCLTFIISFALSDQVSATLLKPYFHRLRPCNNPYLAGILHLLVPCGGGYSFPSSHASNHFSMAMFSAATLGSRVRWIWPVAILWAACVSFAQVYVGVHFPLDVTCGALLGTAIGLLTGKVFNRAVGLQGNAI